MEILKENENSQEIILNPELVEKILRSYIINEQPDFRNDNWSIGAKYNLGTVVFHATKE